MMPRPTLSSVTFTCEIKRACNLQIKHHVLPVWAVGLLLLENLTYFVNVILFGHHFLHLCVSFYFFAGFSLVAIEWFL